MTLAALFTAIRQVIQGGKLDREQYQVQDDAAKLSTSWIVRTDDGRRVQVTVTDITDIPF